MHLDMEGIKLGLEKYLSHFFHCVSFDILQRDIYLTRV